MRIDFTMSVELVVNICHFKRQRDSNSKNKLVHEYMLSVHGVPCHDGCEFKNVGLFEVFYFTIYGIVPSPVSFVRFVVFEVL